MARDSKGERLVDLAIRIGELDIEIVDGRGQGHVRVSSVGDGL